MSDETKPEFSGGAAAAATMIRATGIPPAGTPVAYADGIANLAHGKNVVKFYLLRADPDVAAVGPVQIQVVAQIVMPIDGFVRSIIFLTKTIQTLLIPRGAISQEEVEQIRSEVDKQ